MVYERKRKLITCQEDTSLEGIDGKNIAKDSKVIPDPIDDRKFQE